MSDAAPTTLHRVVSDRHFFGKSLAVSTACLIVAAIGFLLIVLCCGSIAELLAEQRDLAAPGNQTISGFSKITGRFSGLNSPATALTTLSVLIIGTICLRSVLRSFAQRKINRHVSSGVNRLREHIQRHAIRSNPGDLNGGQRRTATSLFKTTAQSLQDAASNWAFHRITSICDLAILILVLLSLHWRIGLECLIPVMVCWFVARIESERDHASSSLLIEQVDRGLHKLTTDLDKARIVAGYGMESLEHEQFRKNLDLYQSRSDCLRQQKLRGRWTSMLITIVMIALPSFLVARHMLIGSSISIPTGLMIAVTTGLIIVCLRRLQQVPVLLGTATAAADEINQYLRRVPPVSQVVGARFLEPLSRSLQFNQVCLETEGNPELIHNLDLKIEAGQRVALLAVDDNEAVALVSLIPRFCDPTSGQVLIDGQDIKRATLESLRAEAVVVGGNDPVFSATVLENITAGQSDISKQDAIEACKITHAESFIRQLPQGYETELGTDAVALDVGQVFRLSLARAIARKPALLVVQEPTEALDNETKTMLDDTNQRICSGRTVIFLPTRLSTVKKCDRVVVIHNGRVAADGKHDELVKTSEVYRHWEYMRFNVFRPDR